MRRYSTGRQSAIEQQETPLPGCFSDSNQPCSAGSAFSGGAAIVAPTPSTAKTASHRTAPDRRSTPPPLDREARSALSYRRQITGRLRCREVELARAETASHAGLFPQGAY